MSLMNSAMKIMHISSVSPLKQPVFSAHNEKSNGTLGGVIINFRLTLLKINNKSIGAQIPAKVSKNASKSTVAVITMA